MSDITQNYRSIAFLRKGFSSGDKFLPSYCRVFFVLFDFVHEFIQEIHRLICVFSAWLVKMIKIVYSINCGSSPLESFIKTYFINEYVIKAVSAICFDKIVNIISKIAQNGSLCIYFSGCFSYSCAKLPDVSYGVVVKANALIQVLYPVCYLLNLNNVCLSAAVPHLPQGYEQCNKRGSKGTSCQNQCQPSNYGGPTFTDQKLFKNKKCKYGGDQNTAECDKRQRHNPASVLLQLHPLKFSLHLAPQPTEVIHA